jgi:hypothetical protein
MKRIHNTMVDGDYYLAAQIEKKEFVDKNSNHHHQHKVVDKNPNHHHQHRPFHHTP